jgi:hypothetical protein
MKARALTRERFTHLPQHPTATPALADLDHVIHLLAQALADHDRRVYRRLHG